MWAKNLFRPALGHCPPLLAKDDSAKIPRHLYARAVLFSADEEFYGVFYPFSSYTAYVLKRGVILYSSRSLLAATLFQLNGVHQAGARLFHIHKFLPQGIRYFL